MTRMQFDLQMDRLIETYGKAPYSKARVDALYEIVRNVEVDDFVREVDEWILTERTAPLGQHFQAVLSVHLKRKHAEEVKRLNIGPTKCFKCGDSGEVLAIRIDDLTKWAFLCPFCDAAKATGKHGRDATQDGQQPTKNAYWDDCLSGTYMFQTPPPKALAYSENV